MNKVLVGVFAGIIFVVLAGTVLLSGILKPEEATVNTSPSTETKTETIGKKACELIDLSEAKSLIGDSATLLEGSGNDNLANTEEVTVDNCSYSADGATLGDMKQITIQVHSGEKSLVKLAYENFRKEYPGDDLGGLGDDAYVSSESGQVSVLKGNSWFFVFGGSMNDGTEVNKELAIQAAKVALNNL